MPTPYAEHLDGKDPVEVLRSNIAEYHELTSHLTKERWARSYAPAKERADEPIEERRLSVGRAAVEPDPKLGPNQELAADDDGGDGKCGKSSFQPHSAPDGSDRARNMPSAGRITAQTCASCPRPERSGDYKSRPAGKGSGVAA